jgi:CxxC-x17-CxxC domain-containing protein
LVGKNNNNVSGDNIFNCNNVHGSYDIYDSSDSKYCYDGIHVKDSYDSHSLDGIELCYETTSTIGYHYLFTIACRDSNDITCCDSCFNCKDLFGCIGLKHNKYCILNKQYSKEQYEKLVPEIVENMIKTKEWGEFFPAGLSPFCYNETEADTYYPMPREKALQTGFKWKEEDAMNRYQGPKIRLPDNIAEVNDDITKQILCCESCSKNYRIIIQELDFYRRVKLPVPHKCPDCRHKERLTKRNPRKLWDRKCAKCGAEIQTTFEPDHPETVYCEQCYLKEIY